MIELTEDDFYLEHSSIYTEPSRLSISCENPEELKQQILKWQEDSEKLETAYEAVQRIRDERNTAWTKLEKITDLVSLRGQSIEGGTFPDEIPVDVIEKILNEDSGDSPND